MQYIKSRNQKLNTYINSFMELQYQPAKMFVWRIVLLSLLVIIASAQDYYYYKFGIGQWFSWSPLLIALSCLLTLNFQSLCLGSMSYQYRHHDTPFQIAREFPEFEYSLLINGLEHRLNHNKRTCQRSHIALFSLPIVLLMLINSKAFLLSIIFSGQSQYIALSIYVTLILLIVSISIAGSIFIVARKRQIELIELALFWIKSASNLRYINQ